jgi:hypothetical protein
LHEFADQVAGLRYCAPAQNADGGPFFSPALP